MIWEATHRGHVPDGKNVCHRCDNPGCVNPDHLFIGSQRDNLADMTAKGRRRSSLAGQDQQGEKNRHAKLTEDDVREIRFLWVTLEGTVDRAGTIAKMFGIHPMGVSRIARRERWKHVS